VEELSDGSWSPKQNITVIMDYYNWPQHPSIAIGLDGVAHAFWYQSFHDDCLNQSGEAVYYKTLESGTWVDRSILMNGHIGNWTDISLDRFGEPNLIWCEMIGAAEDVMLAGYEPAADITDSGPEPSLRIGAGPNPFGAMTTLTYETAEAGPLDLRIVDLAGRLVRRLAAGEATRGVHRVPWDGRDESGRPLPAGAYRARLAAGGKTGTCGLVLLR
jgi:hypothetical protein